MTKQDISAAKKMEQTIVHGHWSHCKSIALSVTIIRLEGEVRILKTKWFARFVTKHNISDQKLKVAIEEVESGIIDADLGGGLLKKRIAREGEGKSGGYRTIIAYRRRETAIFGFSKNKMDNVDAKDLASLREIASELEAMTEIQIGQLLDQGRLKEIK